MERKNTQNTEHRTPKTTVAKLISPVSEEKKSFRNFIAPKETLANITQVLEIIAL